MSDHYYLENPFAIALLFYFNYFRHRINSDDLNKIAKKYVKKPDNLLYDLRNKYLEFNVPPFVTKIELMRIINSFSIPKAYLDLLPKITDSYDSKLDVLNDKFDSEYCIQIDQILCAADIKHLPIFDNMTKVPHLLPGNTVPVEKISPPVNSQPLSSSHKPEINTNISKTPASKHLFHQIAEISTQKSKYRNDFGEETILDNPMNLLKVAMEKKLRIRVVLRRNKNLRGSLDGFVRAFDKHFNLLLYDVDEEYLINKQHSRKMLKGKFTNQHQVLHRFLPQVFLRGDNVVTIFTVPQFI